MDEWVELGGLIMKTWIYRRSVNKWADRSMALWLKRRKKEGR